MTFLEYQNRAHALAFYPKDKGLEYCGLKLAGEAGEVAEKIGKAIRDGKPSNFTMEMVKELGDVLWYLQELAEILDWDLEAVAEANIKKLESRRDRGVLGGSGDNR